MVRTRFAPSPTGYLHIGGVRTALFNWLYARQHKGQFLLRIDDTDQGRNNPAALAPILHGLRWCGIDWDEGPEVGGAHGPYFQSEKSGRYQEAVNQLLDKGFAYFDYSTEEERTAETKAAEKEKRPKIYSRRWMAETPADRTRFEAEGRKAAVRLKMPREGVCEFDDHIRGAMRFEWANEQDHFIQRADGTFIYHLANVVDDEDMKITHVIRAEEHLSNTPRQIFILRGLGYTQPEYAHLPFVAEPGSKNKLSKRKIANYLKIQDFKARYDHGENITKRIDLKTDADTFNPIIVDFYEKVGYLPDAIVNYLLLLGWSYDDKKEDFTRQEMIDLFTFENVNKGPASFDVKKLFSFQERYMTRMPVEEKAALVHPYLARGGLSSNEATVRAIVKAAGDRIKVAGDILDYDFFFLADSQLQYDEKEFEKRLKNSPEGVSLLKKYREVLANASSFEPTVLEKDMNNFLQTENVKLGQVNNALRVAVTGKGVSFGIFETLAILGKDRCLARIDQTLVRAGVR